MNQRSKVLVLVADIDDDLGSVDIDTPIIGYSNVLEKAIDFAKKKPHDSDVNSLFGGLAVYEKLVRTLRDSEVEIAVIAGDRRDWTRAVLRINEQLRFLKDRIGFEKIYFVSDGVSDEQLIPVISNYGEIIGVERIIVEQSKGIEETYILLIRYIKKALTEPPYTKFFLGLPGTILFIWGLLSILGLSRILWSSILLILGIVFIIKGFNITGIFREKWEFSPIVTILYMLGIILIGIAVFLTGSILYVEGVTIYAFISLLNNTLYPYFIGLILIYGGRIFEKVLRGKPHLLWRDSVFMALIIFFMIILRNLEEKISSLPANLGLREVINIVITSETMILLLITILAIFIITVIFTILEKQYKTKT